MRKIILALTGFLLAASNSTALADTNGLFDETYKLQGIQFRVISKTEGSVNKLRIIPSGLKSDNSPIEREIIGSVTGAEIADLNGDGSPEIYVYITAPGSGSYGELVAYAVNNKKSLSGIHLPELSRNKHASKGYMGHDEFAVGEKHFTRRFPVYNEGDSNAAPTGRTRQISYKLTPLEVGWILMLTELREF